MIQIRHKDGSLSFFGNQAWLKSSPLISQRRADILSKSGCGLVSMGDFLLLLTKNGLLPETPLTEKVSFIKNDWIEEKEYLSFLLLLYRLYLPIFPKIGVQSPILSHAVNHYAESYHLSLHTHWETTQTAFLNALEALLKEGRPSIVEVGQNFPNPFGGHSIPFYSFKNGDFIPFDRLCSHFLLFLGDQIISPKGHFLHAASWGKEGYFCLEKFLQYNRRYSGFWFGNIMSYSL
ncbi:protein of unknown function [Ruminococcaceae bacterium BL-4]|jgi:hypothetical protein|nr:protein of unknown function [Ruminococcaceae bacterium BL-4]